MRRLAPRGARDPGWEGLRSPSSSLEILESQELHLGIDLRKKESKVNFLQLYKNCFHSSETRLTSFPYPKRNTHTPRRRRFALTQMVTRHTTQFTWSNPNLSTEYNKSAADPAKFSTIFQDLDMYTTLTCVPCMMASSSPLAPKGGVRKKKTKVPSIHHCT